MEEDSMRPSPVVMSQDSGDRLMGLGASGFRKRSLPVEFSKNQRGTKRKVAVRVGVPCGEVVLW